MKKKILLYLICFFALQIKAQIIPQNGTIASSPEFIALKNAVNEQLPAEQKITVETEFDF